MSRHVSLLRLLAAAVCLVGFAHAAAAQDLPLSQLLIPDKGWELVGEGYKFTEAPCVDALGNVYFADVPESKIYQVAADGPPTVYLENTERTSGLMFGPGGRLFGCQSGARRIVAYEPANEGTGKVTVIAEDVDCNDLVVTGAGGVYFTDPKNQQVWYVDPQGKKQVVDKGIALPNGITLWPDQQTLVVADTKGLNLWTFRVNADGTLSFKQPYYPVQGIREKAESGADGMKVDKLGRLYCATFAGLQVFDTQGRLSGVILKPQEKFLSNVVLGGPQFDMLYVTCTDKVYRRPVKAAGVRYFDGP